MSMIPRETAEHEAEQARPPADPHRRRNLVLAWSFGTVIIAGFLAVGVSMLPDTLESFRAAGSVGGLLAVVLMVGFNLVPFGLAGTLAWDLVRFTRRPD